MTWCVLTYLVTCILASAQDRRAEVLRHSLHQAKAVDNMTHRHLRLLYTAARLRARQDEILDRPSTRRMVHCPCPRRSCRPRRCLGPLRPLERVHGASLVRWAIGLLVVSTHGRTVPELEDLLSMEDSVLNETFAEYAPSVARVAPQLVATLLADLAPLITFHGGAAKGSTAQLIRLADTETRNVARGLGRQLGLPHCWQTISPATK